MERENSGFAVSELLKAIAAGLGATLLSVSPMLLLFLWLAFGPGAVVVVSREKIGGPAGISLEAIEINHDFIGNWNDVTVYARRANEVRKTVVFSYNPAYQAKGQLPQISFPGKQVILIAVPWIDEALVRRERWNGYRVEYRIDKITYAR